MVDRAVAEFARSQGLHLTAYMPLAYGKVLAEPVMATLDVPPFDNSAMDGYALRASDVRGNRI